MKKTYIVPENEEQLTMTGACQRSMREKKKVSWEPTETSIDQWPNWSTLSNKINIVLGYDPKNKINIHEPRLI